MPRYSNRRDDSDNRYTPALEYEPQDNSEFNKRLSEIVAQRQGRYDVGQEMLGKYQEQLNSAPIESIDRAYLEKQLGKDMGEINDMVTNKYAGDYGNIGAIQRELSSRRGAYQPLLQRHSEQQKHDALVNQLSASGELVWTGDDYRNKATYDENGKVQMPKFNTYAKRDDYDKSLLQKYGHLANRHVEDKNWVRDSKVPWLLNRSVAVGVHPEEWINPKSETYIKDDEVKNFLKENPTFQYDFDIKGADGKVDINKARQSIATRVSDLVTYKTDYKTIEDKMWKPPTEAVNSNGKYDYHGDWSPREVLNPNAGSVESARAWKDKMIAGYDSKSGNFLNRENKVLFPKDAWSMVNTGGYSQEAGSATTAATRLGMEKKNTINTELQKEFQKTKEQYPEMWKASKGNIPQFIHAVGKDMEGSTKTQNNLWSSNNPKTHDALLGEINRGLTQAADFEIKELSGKDLNETGNVSDNKKVKEFKTFNYDFSKGRIIGYANGKTYEVPIDVLDKRMSPVFKTMKEATKKDVSFDKNGFTPFEDEIDGRSINVNTPDGVKTFKHGYVKDEATGLFKSVPIFQKKDGTWGHYDTPIFVTTADGEQKDMLTIEDLRGMALRKIDFVQNTRTEN